MKEVFLSVHPRPESVLSGRYRGYLFNDPDDELESLDGRKLKRIFKDYQLLYVGRSIDDIKGKVSRAKVAEARKKARAKRRLGQEGVSAQNVMRESRRVG